MSRVISTPTVLGGKKRIAGTRISVDLVYNYVRAGKVSQFRHDYPHVTSEQVLAAVRYLERQATVQRRRLESAAA